MSRAMRFALGIMAIFVIAGLLYLPGLRLSVQQLSRSEQAENQARREIARPPIATPSDVKVKARAFWAAASRDALAAVEIELPLSADPVLRAKQLIEALILRASDEQRTLPADVALLEFYLLPDGTAVADFSGALASTTPSGILSEQLALDSVTRTLAANVEQVRRLKILIQGQEADTLAGHVDLSGYFELRPATPAEMAPVHTVPAEKAPPVPEKPPAVKTIGK